VEKGPVENTRKILTVPYCPCYICPATFYPVTFSPASFEFTIAAHGFRLIPYVKKVGQHCYSGTRTILYLLSLVHGNGADHLPCFLGNGPDLGPALFPHQSYIWYAPDWHI